ncbi:MAG: carboxypeptidase-like regulatory domain-containing protein [Fidelibacterota bacterium]
MNTYKNVIGFVVLALFAQAAFAGNTGKISGTVTDQETGEPLAGVNVIIDGTSLGAATNENGVYVILQVPPGIYKVSSNYIGYAKVTTENIRAVTDLTTLVDFQMRPEVIEGETVTIIAEKPLFERSATNEVRVVRGEDIQNLPVRGVNAVAALQTGVVSNAGLLHVRGGRTDETAYFVDGVLINNAYDLEGEGSFRDATNFVGSNTFSELPNLSLEEVSYQAGGFNAEYGSANAGIINTSTREGRDEFHGTVEVITDNFLPNDALKNRDAFAYSYGYNVLSGHIRGPLPMPGFRWLKYSLTGERKATDDWRPSVGNHPVFVGELNPQTGLPDNAEPFTDSNGNGIWDDNEDYTDKDGDGDYTGPSYKAEDIDYVAGPLPNNDAEKLMFNGNVVADLKQTALRVPLKVKLGGSYFDETKDLYSHSRSLFNYYNTGAGLKLRFPTVNSTTWTAYARLQGAAPLPKTFFSLQFSLFSDSYLLHDPAYGKGEGQFIYDDGSISDIEIPYVQYGKIYDLDAPVWTYVTEGGDTTTSTQPVDNYIGVDYDTTWINPLLPAVGTPPGLADSVAQFQYAGRVYAEYRKNITDYWGLTGSLTQQRGNHEMKAGFEYRDYTIRFYRIAGLGGPMRLASTLRNNPPYSQRQSENIMNYHIFVQYDENADSSISQSEYDKYWETYRDNLYLNAYADNLGYDITGQTYLDEGDNGARTPVIGALYIQDKVELKDLILNLGLRYDYIDPANLRFNPATGGNLNIILDQGKIAERVYYLDTNQNGVLDPDAAGPDGVVGTADDAAAGDFYRSASATFYDTYRDAQNNLIFASSDGIDNDGDGEVDEAGEQTPFDLTGRKHRIPTPIHKLLSPRIGLAFPVTEKTVFHAQYGTFIQQPELNRTFISYSRFVSNLTQGNYTTSSNPELEPVKTTAYEIGFKQLLTENASIDLTLFYKQMSGYVQIRNVGDEQRTPYPVVYAIYVNGDYGTVKGLSFSFNLRRTRYLQVNAGYTLSWAGGTGSNSFRQFTIAWQDGNPPTYISPLEFDQRHTGNLSLDFRTGRRDIIPEFGANLLFRFGSGLRFTPSHARSEVFSQSDPSRPKAALNSGAMPWTFDFDLKLDKTLRFGPLRLNAYLWVINVLNRKNVLAVYSSTDEPDTDKWLLTDEGRNWANNLGLKGGASDIYQARISHPYNWGQPRQVRLGVMVDL